MATFVKLNGFVEHLAEKLHNLGSDQLALALTNTAPASESTPPTGATGSNILANLTQISYTNLSSRNVTTSTSAQTSGTYKLVCADLVLTASAAVPTFRYVYLYNTATTSPANALIGYWDYGSPGVTLATGETLTVDFDGTNGVLTLA
jgi:hypothetical protein